MPYFIVPQLHLVFHSNRCKTRRTLPYRHNPIHPSTGKILAFPSRPVRLLQNRKPSSLPVRYQLDIPLPLSPGYPTSRPHNVTPNTHHNHVPSDLPPGIPKRDLVLAILFSSSSSVSVIVKPGPRYLHVSAVCQLQQPNLTHTPRQAINQSNQ